MTDEEINAMTALADAAIKNDGWSHVHYVEVMHRFQNSFNPTAIKGLIERLEKADAENENVRRANLDCVDHFNQMRDDLAEAYRALVCLVDCDLYNPKWDDHCRVQEKARAFVEGEEK